MCVHTYLQPGQPREPLPALLLLLTDEAAGQVQGSQVVIQLNSMAQHGTA